MVDEPTDFMVLKQEGPRRCELKAWSPCHVKIAGTCACSLAVSRFHGF